MTKSEINKNYNIDKIVTAKELALLSKTYKDNLDTIIVTMKRKAINPSKPPAWFAIWNQEIFSKVLDRLSVIESNQVNDRNLLIKVIKLNNLKTK